jgi:hypothetical protein
MTDPNKIKLADEILIYCKKFSLPLDFLFEILEDQKVTPMIRGKAMEYNAYLLLDSILSKAVWSVQKLNLNAQTGVHDEDISITHRRSGMILTVECKSGVRGSINTGKKSRKMNVPYFNVKCHRSRSNIKLANSSNDRYSVDSFDVIITNPLNAIYQGATVGEHLEIVHNSATKILIDDFYKVDNEEDLISACSNDWRFVIPKDIAENGFIPRTPFVMLENDPHWQSISMLETRLLEVIDEKRKSTQTSRRK